MKNEAAIREILICNTIHLVAEGGFEMATTKAITHGDGTNNADIRMNEVYIYRLYGGKTQLYDAAFYRLDHQLFGSLHNAIATMGTLETDTKAKLYDVFLRTWKFVLGNEDNCRCYMRYYYSAYFKGGSRKAHNLLFNDVINDFRPLFKQEADVTSIMHSVFTTLLDFAIRVYNSDLENTQTNQEHIFNVLYSAMVSYFKPEIASTIQS